MPKSDAKYEVPIPGENAEEGCENEATTADESSKIESGLLLQGRWRLSRQRPFYDDENSLIIAAKDVQNPSTFVAVKIYKSTGVLAMQKFRKSVELLLTFRGRFSDKGGRIEGSQNLDLVIEELRAQTNLSDFAAAHSFLSHMNFRSVIVDIINFSHDADWMPAADPETNLLFIVMECPDISLKTRLNDCLHSLYALTLAEIQQIHWALVTTVCGLHTEGYVHLDMKPANIFRYTNERGKTVWKLIDVDAVVKSGSFVRLADLSYTLDYAPPELAQLYLKGQREGGRIKLCRSMNVWTAGMVALETVSLMPVFNVKYSWYQKWKQTKGGNMTFIASIAGEKSNLGLDKIIPSDLSEAMRFLSKDMAHILEIMLVKEPKHRASIGQCLLHRWFEAKRKAVFNLRWGIEEDSDEEEELDATGQRKKKIKPRDDPPDDEPPATPLPKDLSVYIKAQVAKSAGDSSTWASQQPLKQASPRNGCETM